jgi:hypothetical protein
MRTIFPRTENKSSIFMASPLELFCDMRDRTASNSRSQRRDIEQIDRGGPLSTGSLGQRIISGTK